MNFTVEQILEINDVIRSLMSEKWPVNERTIKVSFSLGRLQRKLNDEVREYEQQRIELVKKYGEETEKKGEYQVSIQNVANFQQAHNSLLDLSLSLDIEDYKLNVNDFQSISLPGDAIQKLYPLFAGVKNA